MIERAWVGGVLVAMAGVVLPAAAVGAGDGAQPSASEPAQVPAPTLETVIALAAYKAKKKARSRGP